MLSNLKIYLAVREALFVPSRHSPTAAKDILRESTQAILISNLEFAKAVHCRDIYSALDW